MLFPAQSQSQPIEYVVRKLDMSAAIAIAEFVEKEGSLHVPIPRSLILAHGARERPTALHLTEGAMSEGSHNEL